MTVLDRAARLGAVVGLAALVTACAGSPTTPRVAGSPPPATDGWTAAPSGPAGPASTAPATGTPSAEAVPEGGSPPAASTLPESPPAGVLSGLVAGRTARGELGSYTWAGGGTDAPWVVGPELATASEGSSLTVMFGALVPLSWTAAWATVADGTAGSPTGEAAGSGVVSVGAPSTGGDWSLRVTASFGPGANATYFWHLTVVP